MTERTALTFRRTLSRCSFVRALTLAILTASTVGCRAAGGPPPPALQARVSAAADLAGPLDFARRTVRAVLGRKEARTELQGVMIRGPGAVRLQLFPDVGAKVLDLWVGSKGIVCLASGPLVDWQGGPELRKAPDELPSSEMEAFAYTAYRVAQPLRPEDLQSVVANDEGWRARLPKLAGLDVSAELTFEGEVREYGFSRFGADWSVRHSAPRVWTLESGEVQVELQLGAPEVLEPELRSALEPPPAPTREPRS